VKIDVPMPLLLKGQPARCAGERFIWLQITRTVDVPEISSNEVETVLKSLSSTFFRQERIVARDGVTYSNIGQASDLFAFTSRIEDRPSYIGDADPMRAFAVSRPVMEHQARSMFLEGLQVATHKLWPKQPSYTNQRDSHRFETHSGRLPLDQVVGMEESIVLQDRRLAGMMLIDGELWAECGKPCIVVRANDKSRAMASIGITTLPMWTETSFSNAYFALDQLKDANLYRASLTHALGSNWFLNRMPEFDFETCEETSFDGDEWEAERLTEVIGTDVLALSRFMENDGYLTDSQLAAANAVYRAARETNHLIGRRTSVIEHLTPVLEAWRTLGYRTIAANVPAPKASLMTLPANRALLAGDATTISIPVTSWSSAP
jgi:hypothetical protein